VHSDAHDHRFELDVAVDVTHSLGQKNNLNIKPTIHNLPRNARRTLD
jgi:hypothetical protein